MKTKLLQGDCLELMNDISNKSVDMILCDLPYGTTNCKWDSLINLEDLWCQYKRIIKSSGAILLFSQPPFDKVLGCSNLKWLRYEWIWQKTQPTGFLNAKKMPMKAHENILVFYNRLPVYNPQKTENHKPVNSFKKTVEVQNKCEIYNKTKIEIVGGGSTERYPIDVITYKKDVQKSSLHPTQKPVELLQYLIKTYTDEAEKLTVSCLRGYEIPVIYGTDKEVIGIHAKTLIDLLEEHDAAYEDYEVDDAAKDFIKDFVKTFNRKHAEHSYSVNKEVVIELTAEEKTEAIKTLKKRIKELEERGY